MQHALDAMFARHRDTYWHRTWFVLVPVFLLVLVIPATIGIALAADVSFADTWLLATLIIPVTVSGTAIAWVVSWPSLGRPLTEWLRDGTGDPAHVWRLADRGPTITNLIGTAAATVIALVGYPLVVRELIPGLPLSTFVVLVLVATPPLLGLQVYGTRVVVRPILREISLQHPEAFLHARASGGVRNAVVIGAASITLYGVLLGAATTEKSTLDAQAHVILLGLLAVVVMTFSATVFLVMIGQPVLQPLRDLTDGVRRVATGVVDGRIPVTSRDELGELCMAFNEMQSGLREREQLHAAFGSYVDPTLAERLLAQPDSLFAGEEVEVTVMFVDIRGFTAWTEHATPQQAVARLNQLFEVVVPVLREHGGHANKYLGDGVLGVFGVPVPLEDHAGAAVRAAREIQRRVHDRFRGELELGIGINTGTAIAGTIGGGGKLEFTLIGDVVNVAARVEELTKQTDDTILATDGTVSALPTAVDRDSRGSHVIRGRAEPVAVWALTA